MTRDELIAALRAQADLFRAERVRHVSLFGSQARGDARPDSDVDLLVEYEPDARVGLWAYCGLQFDLTERLGREVHLLKTPIRRESLRQSVEQDAILVL